MATNSAIEWTDTTWNPVSGCSIVSPGCHNCYAMQMAGRLAAMGQEKYVGTTKKVNGRTLWTGNLRMDYDALSLPLKWRKPKRIFVNSMSDLFHESIPDDFIRRVFAIMSFAGQHTFQVLTKRPERMAAWFSDEENSLSACQAEQAVASDYPRTPTGQSRIRNLRSVNGTCKGVGDGNYWPLPNVWLGVSVEDQQRADERIPHLLATPAAVRFLSCEPLLGPVDLSHALHCPHCGYSQSDQRIHGDHGLCRESGSRERIGVDWVIVGGESGHNARPCDVGWIRSVVEQCKAAGVACFVKQDSGLRAGMQGRLTEDLWSVKEYPNAVQRP